MDSEELTGQLDLPALRDQMGEVHHEVVPAWEVLVEQRETKLLSSPPLLFPE